MKPIGVNRKSMGVHPFKGQGFPQAAGSLFQASPRPADIKIETGKEKSRRQSPDSQLVGFVQLNHQNIKAPISLFHVRPTAIPEIRGNA